LQINNQSALRTVITQTALYTATDLAISKSVTPTIAYAGDTMTYTLIVTNSGPYTASNVTVVDALPMSYTVASTAISQGGGCSFDGPLVECDLDEIGIGATATITIAVTTDAALGTEAVNYAAVSASNEDPDLSNNAATVETQVLTGTELVITYRLIPQEVNLGGNVQTGFYNWSILTLRGTTGNAVAIIEGTEVKGILGAQGTGTYGLASDPIDNRFFVVNRDAGSVQVIYRNEFGTWRNDGPRIMYTDRSVPFEAVFNPNNQKLYVVSVRSENWYVDVFEQLLGGSFVQRSRILVGQGGSNNDPNVGGSGLAVNLATNNVFNVNTAADTISVIDGDTDQPVATLNTGDDPFTIVINATTRTVYVALRAVNRLVAFQDIY
jgi:uncharacterized repeat protein (TIGR01451 family)